MRLRKRHYIVFVVITILILLRYSKSSGASSGNGDLIVHVTITGDCYHREGCAALKSDIEITLEKAYVDGYLPCERCNPPRYTGSAIQTGHKEKSDGIGTTKEMTVKDESVSVLENKSDDWMNKAFYIFVGIALAYGIYLGCKLYKKIKKGRRIKQESKQRMEAEREERHNLYNIRYRNKTIYDIVDIPSGFQVDDNGLVSQGSISRVAPHGNLTVFLPDQGKSFHSEVKCRLNHFWKKTDIFDAVLRGYKPCPYCVKKNQQISVPEWYLMMREELAQMKALQKEFEAAKV